MGSWESEIVIQLLSLTRDSCFKFIIQLLLTRSISLGKLKVGLYIIISLSCISSSRLEQMKRASPALASLFFFSPSAPHHGPSWPRCRNASLSLFNGLLTLLDGLPLEMRVSY